MDRRCLNCFHVVGVTIEEFCPKCGQVTVPIKTESTKKKVK